MINHLIVGTEWQEEIGHERSELCESVHGRVRLLQVPRELHWLPGSCQAKGSIHLSFTFLTFPSGLTWLKYLFISPVVRIQLTLSPSEALMTNSMMVVAKLKLQNNFVPMRTFSCWSCYSLPCVLQKVPFISEDLELECEGKDKFKCGSNVFWKWWKTAMFS